MPSYRHLTAEEFRRHAFGGEFKSGVPEDVCVTAASTEVEKAGSEKDRTLSFVISDGKIDRDGDTISIDGWDIENYLKDPVMLWAHDYRLPPIGRAVSVTVAGKKLKALDKFMDADLSPFADQIYRMYLDGWLHATSVGFLPKKWKPSEDEKRRYGIDFIEQELLEHSAVPVPSNARALIEGRGAVADISRLKGWAEQILGMCYAVDSLNRELPGSGELTKAKADLAEATREIERLQKLSLELRRKELAFRQDPPLLRA